MPNYELLPRPWSSDRPRVAGHVPQVCGNVERISRGKRNAWRCTVLVDDSPMYHSHHDTKAAAESKCGAMIKAYAESHYTQV